MIEFSDHQQRLTCYSQVNHKIHLLKQWVQIGSLWDTTISSIYVCAEAIVLHKLLALNQIRS